MPYTIGCGQFEFDAFKEKINVNARHAASGFVVGVVVGIILAVAGWVWLPSNVFKVLAKALSGSVLVLTLLIILEQRLR
jgi:hypothetical protein